MQKLTILNGKEIRSLQEKMRNQFGFAFKKEYAYLLNEKNRIFMVSPDIVKVKMEHLIIDRVGLYIGELWNDVFRLSKEGAEFLGLEAAKEKVELLNTVDLTKEEVEEYFAGKDLTQDLGKAQKLVLLRYEGDVIGCAKYTENKIFNFMPKSRRGEVII